MSKVNQIQRTLLQMDGGEFQKLADAYLAEKGFGRINSVGSVAAANKVKTGTPDALIVTPAESYIFAEYTTQKDGLLGKMREDLDKCLDESKSGVPINKIERVVFCFTGKLNAAEENELAEVCQVKGINLDLFGIDALAFDLYSKYPALARDFLGIPIDTGQIVPPERFVSLSNNKLATRLDLGFHFREEELGQLLDALENERLIMLSGRPGVGKSRLALEACARFNQAHREYEVLCVFGRNRDLWEDLQARFTKPGNFLILVDDANRVSRFEYVVDLLQHQSENQLIKVVATVRDYALPKVREVAQPLRFNSEVELEPLNDEQIKQLITDEYGIKNYHYIERIAEIARGNPRLAIMAAEVAKEAPLSSIHDVSALYDSYFSSIRGDLSDEGSDPASADLLQVAAVVSFFKAVDRTNEEMMSLIEEAFGFTPAVFWEVADRLHEMEVLDMHEDEVVRVSDQVLGTYLFYLAYFKERVLDFGMLIRHFFPKLQHRLIDSINPILNAFDSNQIVETIRPYVTQIWTELEEKGDEEGLLHLLDIFWFTKRTDTLLWVRNHIDRLEPESVDITGITFEKDSNAVASPSIISVLRPFAFVEEEEVRMALDLLSRYLAKRPAEVPVLLRILIDDYGFKPDSYLRQFEVQQAVVDELWSRAESGDPLFSQMFLVVASDYLGTHFESGRMKQSQVFQITRFDLPATPELTTLRSFIWQRLFILKKQLGMREEVIRVIRSYTRSASRVTNSGVIRDDSRHVLAFLTSELEPRSYLHCATMHDYLDLLEKHDEEIPEGLRDQFNSDTYALAQILLPGWSERRILDLSHEEYEQYKRDRLEQHTASYKLEDYAHFFDRCLEIRATLDTRPKHYELQWGAVNVLQSLAHRDPHLYGRVLEQYLERGDPLRLNGHPLVQKLVDQRGRDEALQLLRAPEYLTRRRWLFHVHEVLSADDVDEGMLAHLYELYEAAEGSELPHGLDFLLKYLPLDRRVVAKIVSTLLEKAESDFDSAHVLTILSNPYTEVAERLPDLFQDDRDLLKQAYLVADDAWQANDYDGQVFDRLLDLDSTFIADYVAWKFSKTEKRWLSSHNDQRDYSFIWARPDHQYVMDKAVRSIYRHEQDSLLSMTPYLRAFFQISGDGGEAYGETRDRQDAYLLRIIDKRNDDAGFMEYLFAVIGHFSPDRRYKFVERFVQRNGSFEAFRCLPLEPGCCSWSGSLVLVLQEQVNYFQSLLPIMRTVDLLPHRQYVERHIHGLCDQIEREKKKDFVRD